MINLNDALSQEDAKKQIDEWLAELRRRASEPGTLIDALREVLPPIESALTNTKIISGETHAPCPSDTCDSDNDGFYVRKDGSYGCRKCGASGRDHIDFWAWYHGTDFKGLAERYLGDTGAPPREKKPKARATPENLAKVYSYTDETGAELFQVFRFEEPGREKSFRQGVNGQWTGISGIRRVLYRLPEVVAADAVILVEGEKDADNLEALGFVATTSPMGASNWRPEYVEALRGKHVAIMPDNDGSGQKYLDAILKSLEGVAASVRVVTVPIGKDVSDWIQAGALLDDIVNAIKAAPLYQAPHNPPSLIYIPTWNNCPPETEVLVKLGDTPVLHRQNICMLQAGAGCGKTAALHGSLPTLVNANNPTLGLSAFGRGATVLDTEHDARLFNQLWRRFMRRCGLPEGSPSPSNVKWLNIRAVESLQDRLAILWEEFKTCPGLLIIDGIGDFVSDPNNSDEVTALVYRLSSMAQKYDVGVLLTLHNNPVQSNQKARGVLGSELWRKAQSTLIIERDQHGLHRITTEFSLGKNRQNSDRLNAYFKWSDEEMMHVACEPPEVGETKAAGKGVKQRQEIIAAMVGEYSHTELETLVMEITGVGDRMARKKITQLVDAGLIEQADNGLYRVRQNSHWTDD